MAFLRNYRWVLVPVVLAGVLFVAWNINRAKTVGPSDTGSTDSKYILYAVDSHGAIVASQKDVRGVDRTGRTQWSEASPYIQYVCSFKCPNAVLSGSVASLNSELARDPVPKVLGADVPKEILTPIEGKNQIVSATPKSAIRLATKGGKFAWEIVNSTSPSETRAIPGFAVTWFPNSNNSAAVGISREIGSKTNQAQLFVRKGEVWEFSGDPIGTEEHFACAADNATSYFIDSKHLVKRLNGQTVALAGAPSQITNCSFTRNNLATIQYAARLTAEGTDRTAAVQLYDSDGNPGRHFSVSGSDPYVDADVRSDHLSLFDGDSVRVITSNGKEIAKFDDVDAALFDELGELVTVSKDGQVEWHKL